MFGTKTLPQIYCLENVPSLVLVQDQHALARATDEPSVRPRLPSRQRNTR